MAVYRNTNSHRVQKGDVRIPANGVIEVSGDDEKVVAGLPGVEKLSGADAKAALEQSSGPSADKTGTMVAQEQVDAARRSLNTAMVAAPLQRVIGDDEAPYGPGSGVLSTKKQEALKSEESRRAFAEGEALEEVEEPADPLTPHAATKSPVVHNQQVEAKDAAEEIAERLNGLRESDEPAAEPAGASQE